MIIYKIIYLLDLLHLIQSMTQNQVSELIPEKIEQKKI